MADKLDVSTVELIADARSCGTFAAAGAAREHTSVCDRQVPMSPDSLEKNGLCWPANRRSLMAMLPMPAPNRGARCIARSRARSISTLRLELLPMPARFLDACLRGDKDRAEALIGLHISREWLDEADLIEARLAEFRQDPAYAVWGLRAVALAASRTMIGHVGFHSLPNPDYLQPYWPNAIELAYTVYTQYRRKGHGHEAVAGLLRWAAGRASIRRFLLSVSADNLPSRRLAEKLGFVNTEEYFDDASRETHLVYVLQGEVLARLVSEAA